MWCGATVLSTARSLAGSASRSVRAGRASWPPPANRTKIVPIRKPTPMLRISKLTDYGTVILACLATPPERRHTAAEVAERTRLALPTVSKLLKSFHRAGLVTSVRGSHGGYQLSRPAAEISAAVDHRRDRGTGRDHRVQRQPQCLRPRDLVQHRRLMAADQRRDPPLAGRDFARATVRPGSGGRVATGPVPAVPRAGRDAFRRPAVRA